MATVNDNASGYTSLEQLVAELKRQAESKIDFVADARQLQVACDDQNELRLTPKAPQLREFLDAEGTALPLKSAKQMADRLCVPVPSQFLERLHQESSQLSSQLLSDLMERSPKRWLIRMLDGRVRAVLSDRYRMLDNYDLAFTALASARDHNGEVLKAWITDDKMSITFTTRQIWDRLNEGERTAGRGSHHFERLAKDDGSGGSLFHPLVTVTNSETGRGGLNVRYGILRARCVNTALLEDVQAERHLGGTLDAGFMSAETIAADSKAIMLKCQDAIRAGFHPATFARMAAIVQGSTEVPIEAPTAAVANVVKHFNLPDAAKDDILAFFIQDYDATAYGLAQAVTRYGQEQSAETGFELDLAAGEIMRSPKQFAHA